MTRTAHFSTTVDGNESGNTYAALNAGDRGFFVESISVGFEPVAMTGSSDVPLIQTFRYTGTASGNTGTNWGVFNFTDGDTSDTTVVVDPTSVGSGVIHGPTYWPGHAIEQSGGSWFLIGGEYKIDFGGHPIYVAPGNSFVAQGTNLIEMVIFFHENLTV